MQDNADLVEMTANIVSAYVRNNVVAFSDLPALIETVFQALAGIDVNTSTDPVLVAQPAVSIQQSVTPDYLICLEDGKHFKSLKRHLRTHYDLSPEEYRRKWNLPADYPMVAPNYAAARSKLAKKMGLGQKPGAKRPSKRD
ncbi:MAG: MucR family transcriptional regulator [Alphaproteobacteria bacterium]|jgi:predicted transcriptional regulator|nr:MucR family transcriptional regulator [Rhodobiaceae bacterium]MBO6541577.1 MucR family transcriptional regulator [Alphaproteobacteria bacterium]MBO6629837.1 MucR family transcriptional regulator [Alphaproteobacteria bacterium]|tara:strand:- start:121 stop:543 length:423 start_codon:yes stop_codon:yes gene_type:complete